MRVLPSMKLLGHGSNQAYSNPRLFFFLQEVAANLLFLNTTVPFGVICGFLSWFFEVCFSVCFPFPLLIYVH
jgi:hypothetical protein